jgi:regulator of cell morphogenesis and NO signaling
MTLNMLDLAQTVREIAIRNPATIRVFESLGIDYCCGGKRPLKEACELANVPVERAIEMLSSLEPGAHGQEDAKWLASPLVELTGHIVAKHHRYVRDEAPRIEMLLEKVTSRHGAAHPELFTIQESVIAMSTELSAHMAKEEQVLFPFLEKMEGEGAIPVACFDSIGLPISRMMADHEDAGELLAKIRALSSSFQVPDGACPSYRGLYHSLEEFERDLHHHVHLENNILFPRAIEMERKLAGGGHDRN